MFQMASKILILAEVMIIVYFSTAKAIVCNTRYSILSGQYKGSLSWNIAKYPAGMLNPVCASVHANVSATDAGGSDISA